MPTEILKNKIFSNSVTQVWLVAGAIGERSNPTRKLLRNQILAEFLNVDPDELFFEHGPYDKPRVCLKKDYTFNAAKSTHTEKSFNVEFCTSHSSKFMMLAISKYSSLGIDINQIDLEMDYSSLVEQFFSEREKRHIYSFKSDLQRNEFSRVWCRKEALIKCVGLGLQLHLEQIDTLDDEVEILGLPHLYGKPRKVRLTELQMVEGHNISLAEMLI